MQARRRPAEPELVVTDSAVAFRPGRGDYVGDWCLRELLGRGGSADVWRSTAAEGGVAALKIPHAHAADLLSHEHSVLAKFRHPGVVAALGLVAAHGGSALALEYVPGGDLVALAGGPARHWLPALRGVLAALCALHTRGWAHCDVKARNVLLASDDSPRLIDFAAARPIDAPLRRSIATAACTPAGDSAEARAADCFAFAVLVYELATGRLPYGATGASRPGQAPDTGRPAVAHAAAKLIGIATDVLCASGRIRDGLAVFADDIESALETYL
jgi:serine/threonine protein kinase